MLSMYQSPRSNTRGMVMVLSRLSGVPGKVVMTTTAVAAPGVIPSTLFTFIAGSVQSCPCSQWSASITTSSVRSAMAMAAFCRRL